MSRRLLCVSLLFFIVVTNAVPVPLSSPPEHVSVREAVARRRHAHHVAFVVRAAQLAALHRAEEGTMGLESMASEGGEKMDASKIDDALGTKEPKESQQQKGEPQASEPTQSDPQQSEAKQSEAKQSDPQQSDPQQSDPQQSEPQQSEPQQSEPQQSEAQQREPQTSEPQQNGTQQSEPQENGTQHGEPPQKDASPQQQTQSNNSAQPEKPPPSEQEASLSKESVQPPFNPSVSTVGVVGAIATVIVAAFLLWSKSSNNSISPVQLSNHAYERVGPEIQTNVSAQSSADADGWNAGWDDDDDWNPEPPSAKV